MHPDLAALIGGAGPAQGPPPEIQVDPSTHPDNQQQASFADKIQAALDELRDAISAPDATEQERHTVEKTTTLLQGTLAGHEKEHQAALGGGPATNFIRRAAGA